MKRRRLARELSLQALYSIDIAHEGLEKILLDIKADKDLDAETWEYMQRLSAVVVSRRQELDDLIQKQCDNWELDRVAVLDKNILRMAIAEILFFEDIPPKVSIDEAIELAKKFSTDKSGQFVNGILDPIAFKDTKKETTAGESHGV
ncbi:MAG: transcription antitermination factor NusB [Candidatus Raymondbacteria bacterium RifOxyA12_full_50_37]|uniref:Transcription antitermination protein NusB n=1 Tax=Candidatus Raymondbacteria bacterium RIFOXYD12_FULL_49_13 TaxID=1817890 RepID=A0A1F7FG79_UNCRA|nr:MAG: transcription antitermination factor NusB [Candidatus Raymondbacteria bacterium RifOxyB12_full_50_8]OGJ91603.1 MAG: transcription antitermination factor NusB [Candidatus Raymondbacteria bacterium RifOxyA12_full_50_37]OGJ92909.1 MAG: transcription antitermination factor NusB [Candidatus Raymondbacteria bacterium RIFOXYA2_FULL_49_16]OGJ94835.1 MAG: transcription antitermination factor NusB [Candidatus Raymondbacteria bacterium RifOxyC12_full_50_8]OGK05705.1 MAG: transcription antiterminat